MYIMYNSVTYNINKYAIVGYWIGCYWQKVYRYFEIPMMVVVVGSAVLSSSNEN